MLGCTYEPITNMFSGFFLLDCKKVCHHNISYRALHFTRLFYLLTKRIFQTWLMSFHVSLIVTQWKRGSQGDGTTDGYHMSPPLTFSPAAQRPQFISCFWVWPACVCNHYLSDRQMFFIRKESGVIGPIKEQQKNSSNYSD